MERHAQEEQHDFCSKRNEDHVDAKLVDGAGKAWEALLCDAVAGRAQGRHEGGCHGNACNEGRGLLLAGVAQPSCKAAGKRDEQVPDRGRRVVEEGAGLVGYGREEEVEGGGCKADEHLERQAGDRVAQKAPVGRCDGVGDGEHRAHERADEHGAHDGLGGVRVEANRGNEHGNDEDAHVRAVKLRSAHEAFADLRPGSATFSHVEGTPEGCDAPTCPACASARACCFALLGHRCTSKIPVLTHLNARLVHSCAPKVGCPRKTVFQPLDCANASSGAALPAVR